MKGIETMKVLVNPVYYETETKVQESNDIICFPQSTNKMLESNNSSQQNESKIENNSGFLLEPMDNDLYHINNSNLFSH